MKIHSIHNLITIGNQTGLEFNLDGNTYKVSNIDCQNRDTLKDIINNDLAIEYVDIDDDGKVFMRTVEDNILKTFRIIIFYIELNDDYMVSDERRMLHSLQSINNLRDDILHAIRRVSIKHHGVHIVANWEDGGSDAFVDDIHSVETMLHRFPTANIVDVEEFMAGRRDGIRVRTWIDDHSRLVCDTAYYHLDEITDSEKDVSLTVEDDRHYIELLMTVQPIF